MKLRSSNLGIGDQPHEPSEILQRSVTEDSNDFQDTTYNDTDRHTAVPYGPVTEEEAERIQQESNEDTIKSEDLRKFLKEMHQRLHEENQAGAAPVFHQNVASVGGTEVGNISPSHASLIITGQAQSTDIEFGARFHQPPYQLAEGHGAGPDSATARQSLTDVNVHESAPPDGGWGWIVVLGSFFCMILVDGVCFSYGLLLSPQCSYSHMRALAPVYVIPSSLTITESQSENLSATASSAPIAEPRPKPLSGSCVPISEMGERVGTQSRMLLLTPGSLLIGVYLLLSPLVSALTNQVDFRRVVAIGVVISTTGFLSSSFVDNLISLSLTYGVLGGIGFAFIYLPAISIVGAWFFYRRPLAVGLAICGSGVGCLLGSQLMPRLVEWYTWQGSLIITAAACFQCGLVVVLFRSVKTHNRLLLAQRSRRTARELALQTMILQRHGLSRVMTQENQKKHLATISFFAAGNKRNAGGTALRVHDNQAPGPHKTVIKATTVNTAPRGVGGGSGKPRQLIIATPTTLATHNALHGKAAHQMMYQMVRIGGGRSRETRSRAPLATTRPSRTKRAPPRRVVYGGTIMQRIIEEKRRQRTTSVGSLDGMVITRDNELIAAPCVANLDKPLLSASVIQRISEVVARKIELKIVSQQQLPSEPIPSSECPTQPMSPISSSRSGHSRSQLRASLPQLIQDYIHSRLSLAGGQPHQPSQLITSTVTSQAVPVIPSSGGATSNLTTVDSSANPCTVQPINVTTDFAAPLSVSFRPPATSGSSPFTQFAVTPVRGPEDAGHGLTESVCLPRTASDASLESHVVANRGIVLPASSHEAALSIVAPDGPVATDVILDDELKAEIDSCVRRELSRPQYKKDLLYANSLLQLDSNAPGRLDSPLTGGNVVVVDKASICSGVSESGILLATGIVPSLVVGSTAKLTGAQRRSIAQLIGDLSIEPTHEMHNSHTNLSLATSVGATGAGASGVTMNFIPPAPCPALPSHSHQTSATSSQVIRGQHQKHSTAQDIESYPATQYSPTPYICDGVQCVRVSNALMTGRHDHEDYCAAPEVTADNDDDVEALAVEDEEDETAGDGDLDGEVGDDLDGAIIDNQSAGAAGCGDDLLHWPRSSSQASSSCCHPRVIQPCLGLVCWLSRCCFYSRLFVHPLLAYTMQMLSPVVLKSPTFVMMLLSTTTAMLGLVVPFLMLPDLLAELNWKLTDSGFVISAIGVGNTFGRLLATAYIEKGWSATYGWTDCLWVNNASLFLTSISVFLMPVVRKRYSLLVLLSGAFGLFSAGFVSMKSILVVELLGIEKMFNAFGYMLVFQGIAAAFGAPVAGYLRDYRLSFFPTYNVFTAYLAPVHNSTTVSFYFSGACLLFGCLFACPLRHIARKEQLHNAKKAIVGTARLEPSQLTETSITAPSATTANLSGRVDGLGEAVATLPKTENPGVYLVSTDGGITCGAVTVIDGLLSDIQSPVPPALDSSASVVVVVSPGSSASTTSVLATATNNGTAAHVNPPVVAAAGCPVGTLAETSVTTATVLESSAGALIVPVSGISHDDGAALVTGPVTVPTVFDGLTAASVGLLTCTSSVSTMASAGVAVPPKAVEQMLGVPGELGLEPVVEEEEEYEEEEEEEEDDEKMEEYTQMTREGSQAVDKYCSKVNSGDRSAPAVSSLAYVSSSSSSTNPTSEERTLGSLSSNLPPFSGEDETTLGGDGVGLPQTKRTKKLRKRRRSTPATAVDPEASELNIPTVIVTSSSTELIPHETGVLPTTGEPQPDPLS